MPYFILGEGTNLLVRDGGIRGITIKLSAGFRKIGLIEEKEGWVYVEAEAGGKLSNLVSFSLKNSLSGLEFAALIPGSVGGGLRMNAGAWGREMKDITSSITFLQDSGRVLPRERNKLDFSYRHLNLEGIILSVIFKLKKGDRDEIEKLTKENMERKRETQPIGLPTAGCLFQNPPHIPAAKLIEEVGLKGFQMGKVAISSLHANFLINLGGAQGKDVLKLMEFVQAKVLEKKGIFLKPEIEIVGEDV